MSVPVKLIGYFARNHRLRTRVKRLVDGSRLMFDPQLQQAAPTAAGGHLRATRPGDGSVNDVDVAFVTAIMRTAELMTPPQECQRRG